MNNSIYTIFIWSVIFVSVSLGGDSIYERINKRQVSEKRLKNVWFTGLVISFHTLEMSCLWLTGSSQNFFEEIPNDKVSSPHYLKSLMKLNKHGNSLIRDPRSIS